MAKPNKKLIEDLLEQWAKVKARLDKIEAAREKALQPFTTAYEKRCAWIHEDANERARPLEEQLKNFEADIARELGLGVDCQNRTCAVYQVATANAIAKVQTSEGNREIAPEKFFAQVPAAKRDSNFWGCVKILIGPAQKVYGSVVDLIAEKPWNAQVVIERKD
jgi:hypothetical protein